MNAKRITFVSLILSIALSSCLSGSVSALDEEMAIDTATSGSGTESGIGSLDDPGHSPDADPDYETVFPQDAVNRLDIVISPENWEAMQANMTELYGEPGTGNRMPGGQQRPGDREFVPDGDRPELPAQPPSEDNVLEGGQPALPGQSQPENLPPGDLEGEIPDQRPGGFAQMDNTENPMWVEATIYFNGDVWEHVGIRFKGNSTLMSAWSSGSNKLPFKLDFDQYEDEYPEIENQRFYGFRQLSLANNTRDASFLREVTAGEVFSNAGLLISASALYEVYLDTGDGPEYLGLYAMVEVVEDTVIETAYGDDDGNIYEADGVAASFASGTQGQIETSFEKENNEDEADWGDLHELYEVLHTPLRTGDPAAWREALEAVFNVDSFLNWLAVTTLTQDWDTYGNMTHNFYLYHNPETDLIEWIAWDKNEAFGSEGMGRALSLSLEDVSNEWPLIRYLMDDPVYAERYRTFLEQAANGAFNPEVIEAWYTQMAEIVAPYAEREVGSAAFQRAVQALIDQAYARYEAAMDYLNQ